MVISFMKYDRDLIECMESHFRSILSIGWGAGGGHIWLPEYDYLVWTTIVVMLYGRVGYTELYEGILSTFIGLANGCGIVYNPQ